MSTSIHFAGVITHCVAEVNVTPPSWILPLLCDFNCLFILALTMCNFYWWKIIERITRDENYDPSINLYIVRLYQTYPQWYIPWEFSCSYQTSSSTCVYSSMLHSGHICKWNYIHQQWRTCLQVPWTQCTLAPGLVYIHHKLWKISAHGH